jgi:cytochrome b561
MTAGQGVTGRRDIQRGRPPGLTLLLAGLLLVGVLVGLRGGFTPPALRGPLRHDGIGIGIALEAVLATLLAAVAVRQRRQPTADFATRRLRTVLRAVLLAGLVTIPIALVASRPLRGKQPAQPSTGPRLPAAPSQRPTRLPRPAPVHLPLAAVLYTLLALLLLAAVVACVLLLRRRRPVDWDALPPDEATLAEGERTELRAAVQSGQRAMAGLDDTRAAIIACYLAMERSLAAAGADRTDADTPAEFLDRAAAAGLVHTAAAGQLTGLFYEARFSPHQLTRQQRGSAEQALRQLAADLAGSGG